MEIPEEENVREVSKLRTGDCVSWWGDHYVEILEKSATSQDLCLSNTSIH
jgi:hypothetical protein